MSAETHYAAGAGLLQHKSDQRLDRDGALACRDYHAKVLADSNASEMRRANSAEMIRQIDAAMAVTWPEQKEAAE